MHNETYEPYQEANELLGGNESLEAVLEDEGYLFFRDVIDTRRIDQARNDIREILAEEGYVLDDPDLELKWSGKGHVGDGLACAGRVGRKISELESLTDVIHASQLEKILRRLFSGEVFSWVENQDRVRVVINEKADVADRRGAAQHVTTATPAHQDFYHFRVDFVTAWIPFVDIDSTTGGLALRKNSHKNELYEHWYKDSIYLGVADSKEEDREFVRMGAVAVGEMPNPMPTGRSGSARTTGSGTLSSSTRRWCTAAWATIPSRSVYRAISVSSARARRPSGRPNAGCTNAMNSSMKPAAA